MDLESVRDWVDESDYIDDDGEYKPAFVIDSDAKATWALRKYSAALNRLSEAEDLATAERQRIDAWLEDRDRVYRRDLDFFGSLLSNYALDQREQTGRKKVDLPDGVVQTRTVSSRFKVTDKDAFLEWAERHFPGLLRVSYAPDMAKVSEHFVASDTDAVDPDTGVIVPGVVVEPDRVTASIKVELG